MEFGALACSVIVEKLNSLGQVVNKKTIKSAEVILGRDELRDIVVKVMAKNSVEHKFLLADAKFFNRFAKNGKATISVKDNINIFISNCPPDKLIMFLKGAAIKISGMRGFATDKTRLYSFKQKTFNEISPLTQLDVQTYRSQQNNKSKELTANKKKICTDKTPKRKRSELDGPRKRINSTDVNNNSSGDVGNQKVCLQPITQGVGNDMANKMSLTIEQKKILEAVKRGRSIFFTGSAGTGKSVLLKRIIGMLPPESTVASASTGVAACHIGGVTLHSFAGIGSGTADLDRCIELAKRPQVIQQWKKCQHLIIDEISMIDGDFFDKIEHIAQVVRKSDFPFGGIQLILCGDFLQLPPVSNAKESAKFCFQADSWDRCIDQIFELTKVQRQKDREFINILQYLRVGKCPDKVLDKLRETSQHKVNTNGIMATRLCSHRKHVAEINMYRMNDLEGQRKVFTAYDDDTYYSKQMDNALLAPGSLELKIGAQVMLTKNIDLQRGLVNGARGVVVSFTKDAAGFPVVVFQQGLKQIIKPEKFILRITPGKFVTRHQIPLQLAWAISIHKSQGLTLDCVEVSLSDVFEHGQAYVALSRAKSMEGLRILDIDKSSIKANPEVLKFYIKLRRQLRMEGETL